jgi:hypothetical protein
MRTVTTRGGRLCVLLTVMVLAAVAGCGGGRAVATSTVGHVDDLLHTLPVVDDAVRIPRAPLPAVPRAQVTSLASAAEEEAIALVAPYVDDLTVGDAQQVVVGACLANDLVVIGGADSWTEAADEALTSFGGRATLRERVAGLAEDMAQARTAVDQAVQVGAFLVCEVV